MKRRRPSLLLTAMALAGLALLARDGRAADYRDLGYLYLSPLPGALHVSPQTRFVLVRLKDVSPAAVTNLSSFITVQGSSSGLHNGQTHIATDGRTIIHEMGTDFTANELVTVTLEPRVGAGTGPEAYQYDFAIATPVGGQMAAGSREAQARVAELKSRVSPVADPADTLVMRDSSSTTTATRFAVTMPNGVSVPGNFPQVILTVRQNPALDYIWLENAGPSGQIYKIILDTWGNPVFYQRGSALDFKPQKNGVITWACFVGVDRNFNYLKSYSPVNGFGPNEHELQVLEDGSYYLIGSSTVTIDMSRIVPGGDPAASVILHAVQGFTAADELVFQWRALDHINILSEQPFIDLTSSYFDISHMNSIDLDEDGHILLSSRNTSECTKIDRDTGEVIWRLGGSDSTFTFVNDPLNGPRQQHCFRALGGGHYLLLDNGNLHQPPLSRAVEYVIDPIAKTATLVWQFRDTPDKFAYYKGSAQRLSNGNTHIDWVLPEYPKAVEVDRAGVKQLEMSLSPGYDLYRSWRAPWTGMLAAPYLIAEAYPDNVTLVFNKFGDPGVDHYNIYSATSPSPRTLTATSRTTLARLNNVVNGAVNYFRVTAVSTNGMESDFSNEEELFVHITRPGENMAQNGDFSAGTANWIWSTNGTGAGTFNVITGACVIHISSPGSQLSDLQLRQAGLPMLQGKQYVLEFDAQSVGGPRPIEVRIGQDASPFATYYLATPSLQTSRRHFTYVFTMNAADDLNARLAFNVGGSVRGIVLDNVSLYMSVAPFSVAAGLLPDGRVELRFTIPGASQATVLGSTNLLNWDVLKPVSLTNDSAAFVDDISTNLPARYYRLRVP